MVDHALWRFFFGHSDVNMLSGKPDDHVIEIIHGPSSATEGAGLNDPVRMENVSEPVVAAKSFPGYVFWSNRPA